jgi:adenylate cyclase
MFSSRENDLLKKALSFYIGEKGLERVLLLGQKALDVRVYGFDATILRLDNEIVSRGSISSYEDFEIARRRYFESVVSPILVMSGQVSGIEGDSVQAWWTKDEAENHALAACRCAMAIRDALPNLNQSSKALGHAEVAIKIGIQTGYVGIGNYGAENRMTYGVLGDPVNAAYTLCVKAPPNACNASILIGEETAMLVRDRIECTYFKQLSSNHMREVVRTYSI